MRTERFAKLLLMYRCLVLQLRLRRQPREAAELQEVDLLSMASPTKSKRAKRTPKQTPADEAGPSQREVKTAEVLTSAAWGQVCT